MKKSQKKALAVGAGVAALAAAAAGVYFLTGKNAKNRKKVAKWAAEMQKDVVKELKKARQNSQAAYNKVVDSVARNYKAAKKVSGPELAVVAADLKSSWNTIRKEMDSVGKTVRRITPKAARSRSRKVAVKKAAKKR
jgi:hypothetical protein